MPRCSACLGPRLCAQGICVLGRSAAKWCDVGLAYEAQRATLHAALSLTHFTIRSSTRRHEAATVERPVPPPAAAQRSTTAGRPRGGSASCAAAVVPAKTRRGWQRGAARSSGRTPPPSVAVGPFISPPRHGPRRSRGGRGGSRQGCIGRRGGYRPWRAPTLCPATVSLTPGASLNGMCNRQ